MTRETGDRCTPENMPILPDYTAQSILDVDFEDLSEHGKTNLLIDLDLTLRTSQFASACKPELVSHLQEARANGSIHTIILVSNSRANLAPFADALEAQYIQPYYDGAGRRVAKPQPAFYEAALDAIGAEAESAVMIGDRYELDVIGAAQAGITTVLVEPLARDYPLDILRRARRRDRKMYSEAQAKAAQLSASGGSSHDNANGLTEQDFDVLVRQKRKSLPIYGQLAVRAARDGLALLAEGKMPFNSERHIYEGCKEIAEYCYEQDIEDIIFVDKSARTLWKGVTAYWELARYSRARPQIHFMNPAFIRQCLDSSTDPSELEQNIRDAAAQVAKQLQEHRSPLLEKTNQPVMIADSCMHTGKAVHTLRRVLESAGFTNLHTGVMNTTLTKNNPLFPDACGTTNVVAARCFRSEADVSPVRNNDESIYSQRVNDPDVLRAAHHARQDLQRLIASYYTRSSVR